jgi:heat shock protein HslJ
MSSPEAQPLVGTTWHLVAFRTADGSVPALTSPASTLVVEDGRAHGTTGVNRFTAECTIDDGSFSLGPVAMTMMAGVGAAADQEAAVTAALNAVAGYRIDDDGLVLTDIGDGELLRYEPLRPTSLFDTEWVVNVYRVADALRSPVADSEATITFAADGGISGTTGCNRYHGQYTLDGDDLALGPLATTRMLGAPELMEQEMAFLSALAAIAGAEVNGDRLRLHDLDGATVVEAAAR